MPRYFAFLLLAAFLGSTSAWGQSAGARKSADVLFIGSSYTYYFEMPSIIAAMSRSATSPRELRTKMVAAGGATLEDHWDAGDAKRAIHERKWDYVVLQEQSTRPFEDKHRMHDYVRRFDQEIKRIGAKTVLFATWSRRERPETQADLTAAYESIAGEIGAAVAPVGNAWQSVVKRTPSIVLYDKDGSHPTPAATYLIACVLYMAIQSEEKQCPVVPTNGVSAEATNSVRAAATAMFAKSR
jgi:hypothetical protein